MSPPSRSAIARYEQRLLAYERSIGVQDRAPATPGPRRARDRPAGRARSVPVRVRMVRISILAGLLMLTIAGVSFASTVMQPSNVGFGVRAVEWLRDNGAAGLVSRVEAIYYSFTAPSTGGPGIKSLPKVGVGGAASTETYRPPPIATVISPPLPGEGLWRGTGPVVRGAPAVLVTTFRPDPNYPAMVAGVAWIDSSRAWIQLYPGRYEPPNSTGGAAEVPPQLRGGLLATFNSGFKLEDDSGGFVSFGHAYSPLRAGQATLIRYRDGSADIRTWTGGPNPGPTVELARQNLPLIVTGGRLNQNLSDGPEWGATLGNAVRVWRSGVGVDAHGNLIYAAANDQTATSLAQILQRAGAVRAMELDINSEWVTFNTYAAPGAADPAKLLPDMTRDPTRYLTPDDRDFFAVYARNG